MLTFAQIALNPGGLIAWLIVGVVAGWLAGTLMKGGGYGLFGDIIVGLIGSFVGGALFGQFMTGTPGLIGSIVVAVIGACLFIAILRMVSGRRTAV